MIAWLTSIAMPPWVRTVLIYAAIVAAILFTILRIRKAGEKMGKLSEKLEQSYELERNARTRIEVERTIERRTLDAVRGRLRERWTAHRD